MKSFATGLMLVGAGWYMYEARTSISNVHEIKKSDLVDTDSSRSAPSKPEEPVSQMAARAHPEAKVDEADAKECVESNKVGEESCKEKQKPSKASPKKPTDAGSTKAHP